MDKLENNIDNMTRLLVYRNVLDLGFQLIKLHVPIYQKLLDFEMDVSKSNQKWGTSEPLNSFTTQTVLLNLSL